MFCSYCGATVREGETFCPNCGTPVSGGAQSPMVYEAPYAGPYAPSGAATYNTGSILTFGILGAAFANTFYISFLGIIFGAIAMKKANEYVSLGGKLTGKAKVGRILGKVALIESIVLTAILLFCIILLGSL